MPREGYGSPTGTLMYGLSDLKATCRGPIWSLPANSIELSMEALFLSDTISCETLSTASGAVLGKPRDILGSLYSTPANALRWSIT